MKRVLILLAVVSGCAGTPETRATNALAIACDSYATALTELTPYKPDMSESQVARVDRANEVVDPVCSSGSNVDPESGVKIVRSAVDTLNSLKDLF